MIDKNPSPIDSHADVESRTMIFYRMISYALLIAVSILLFIEAGNLPASKWEPLGASAFPKIVLGLLAGLSILAAYFDYLKYRVLNQKKVNKGLYNQRLVIYLFILLICYLGATPFLGFRIATFIFLVCAQLLLGPKNVKTYVIIFMVSLLFSFGIYELFAQAFDIYLPRSSWSN